MLILCFFKIATALYYAYYCITVVIKILLLYFIFRDYKTRSNEQQTGWFSTLANMVSRVSIATPSLSLP